MSAVMEHQWLVDGPASDLTKARRAAVLDVVASLTPPGAEAQVMAWRVEAKVAHAALLAQSRSPDPALAVRAERRAAVLMQGCSAIMS
jgi:hypothetical protein